MTVPLRYFKRYWSEDAGGACAGWGGAIYFFECQPDGSVERQIQQFDNGNLLLHDEQHIEDQYGGLSEKPLDLSEFAEFETDKSEFESHWITERAVNWQS